jgi:fucose permease
MANVIESDSRDNGGIFSAYQLSTLYFPAFVFALGYSIATPAIPVLAKSFDTGFGVASLVIVVHALGGLFAAVPTGVLVDRAGRRPILFAGPILMALSSWLTALYRRRRDGNVAPGALGDHRGRQQKPSTRPANERYGRD